MPASIPSSLVLVPRDSNVVEIVTIDDSSDDGVSAYIRLRLTALVLGEGESKSIAMANDRNYIFGEDF